MNSKYPTSSQRISIQTVEDWERADEIFCKMKNSAEDGPLEKAAEAGAISAVPKRIEIAREQKVQSINRCKLILADSFCYDWFC